MDKNRKPIALWLFITAACVFAMVVIGAITRLSESGLSIAEWKPLIGAIPPLSEAEWRRVFDLYRETPEFQQKNFWMGLGDFKTIFFWEWFHRLWGRLIGLVYALPLIVFELRRQIPKGYGLPLFGLLLLGAAQGFLGWFMVQSGLVDNPAVSPYRLAAHLLLALLILSLLIWTGLSLIKNPHQSAPYPTGLIVHGWAALLLAILTITWGAFVAGLDAGLIYNDTFPQMGAHMLPPDFAALHPFWLNFFENHAAVQFTHRWLGMGLAVMVWSFWGHAHGRRASFWSIDALAVMMFVQLALGIATLFSHVHIALAAAHQATAVIILLLLVVCVTELTTYRRGRGARLFA